MFRRRLPREAGANGLSYTVGASQIEIGRFTYGHRALTVREWGEGARLDIGSFCSIADDVTVFLGGDHRTDWISTFPFGFVAKDHFGADRPDGLPISRGDVQIGHDVWLGQGATIMAGVTIGDGAVVAAKGVVVADVPPYGIVGGHPAKLLRSRFDPTIVDQLLRLRWWDLDIDAIRAIRANLTAAPDSAQLEQLIQQHRP